jgi:hypothetical protein
MDRDKLIAQVLAWLERAGRDWRRIDKCIEEAKWYLAEQAGQDEWSTELRDYYLYEFSQVLHQLIDIAVAREEYEWADALTRQRALLAEVAEFG